MFLGQNIEGVKLCHVSIEYAMVFSLRRSVMNFRQGQFLVLKTLRSRQDGRHFPDDIFKCIFVTENVSVPINISLKFVQSYPRIGSGDKPLSKPMTVMPLTHMCVTRPQ